MIYIVYPNVKKHEETIKAIFNKLDFYDYEFIDSNSYDLNRTFSNVIILGGEENKLKVDASKTWRIKVPTSDLARDDKIKIFKQFQYVTQWVRTNSLKKEILNTDIPRYADLTQFLDNFKGQVLEFKLRDGRIIGVYPDKERLQAKYSSEFHVSTILNLSKLQDILGYTKLSVKDL